MNQIQMYNKILKLLDKVVGKDPQDNNVKIEMLKVLIEYLEKK